MVQVNYEKFLLYKMLGVFSPIFFVFFLLYKKKKFFLSLLLIFPNNREFALPIP